MRRLALLTALLVSLTACGDNNNFDPPLDASVDAVVTPDGPAPAMPKSRRRRGMRASMISSSRCPTAIAAWSANAG